MAVSNDCRACLRRESSSCVWRRKCSSSTMSSEARSMMSFSLFFVAMEMEDVPMSAVKFVGLMSDASIG